MKKTVFTAIAIFLASTSASHANCMKITDLDGMYCSVRNITHETREVLLENACVTYRRKGMIVDVVYCPLGTMVKSIRPKARVNKVNRRNMVVNGDPMPGFRMDRPYSVSPSALMNPAASAFGGGLGF